MALIEIILVGRPLVEVKCPTCTYAKQHIRALRSVCRLSVEVEVAPALCEALPRFSPDKEIDEAVVAHVRVSNELCKCESIGKAVVAFQVIIF